MVEKACNGAEILSVCRIEVVLEPGTLTWKVTVCRAGGKADAALDTPTIPKVATASAAKAGPNRRTIRELTQVLSDGFALDQSIQHNYLNAQVHPLNRLDVESTKAYLQRLQVNNLASSSLTVEGSSDAQLQMRQRTPQLRRLMN